MNDNFQEALQMVIWTKFVIFTIWTAIILKTENIFQTFSFFCINNPVRYLPRINAFMKVFSCIITIVTYAIILFLKVL